jgi:hypothetical protein
MAFASELSEAEEVDESYYDALHEDDYHIQDYMRDPVAFMSATDEDTMYYDQAMRAPDKKNFVEAIVKEVNDHITSNHWVFIPRSQVPKGIKVLDSVWSMKRKRDIKTRKVYKHKARLNVHGGQQEFAVNLFETFSPVVNWFSVRLIFTLSLLSVWSTKQVDFVLSYPQAPIEFDMYMNLPKGIQMANGDRNTHVIKLLKNLYGKKQAGRVWNKHLTSGLVKIGFVQSKVDECVFYRDGVIFMVYVDDAIFLCLNMGKIYQAILELRAAGYDIEDMGDLNDYLGINFESLPGGKVKLSQPHPIDAILRDFKLTPKDSTRRTPGRQTVLVRDLKRDDFDGIFRYRAVLGKLNFLEKGSRPEIAYSVHQCARFSESPKESHAEVVMHSCRYLMLTREQGISLDPKEGKSCEVYSDADLYGNWNRLTAINDVSTVKSRTGYFISFAGCPITWASKLQTQIALSTTEAEYIDLSQSLREVIPMINLMTEVNRLGVCSYCTVPKVYCKAFEDNSGALELAKAPKMRPRKKNINLMFHHFRDYVRRGLIVIYPVGTLEQLADIFTKPLSSALFEKRKKKITGK